MIYFIRDEATKFIKIGHTDGDIAVRLRTLQTGCPGPLALLLSIHGSKQDETMWHDRFEAARERGEWFRPVPELLRAIDEMKASIEENVSRTLDKLRKELAGGKGWTSEALEYLLVHKLEEEREEERRRLDEERQKIKTRVAKVRELLDALGPVITFRKLHGVLSALEMQVDDGNYQRQAVARLWEALLSTAELYDIPEFLARELAEAASFSKGDIRDT